VSVTDYLKNFVIGTDEAIYKCGADNMYADFNEAGHRIKYLLEQAEKKVWIQGISLRSFFQEEGNLYEAMYGVLAKGVEVRVLLLDPLSEQAIYRSYREWLLGRRSAEQLTFEGYKSQEYKTSPLCQKTDATIQSIQKMVQEINDEKKTNGSGWVPPNIKIFLYSSAPMCSVLLVDDRVLVEQYHYGMVRFRGSARIPTLEQMPLTEYKKGDANLHNTSSDGPKRPYDLLVDHLQQVRGWSHEVVDGAKITTAGCD
jgi:hypothetical protein